MITAIGRALAGLLLGLAILAVWEVSPRIAPTPNAVPSKVTLALSRKVAGPDIPVQLSGVGFRPNEAVTVEAIDPIGTATPLGQVYADGYGRVAATVAPTQFATNGVNELALIGAKSGANIAAPITLIG